MDENQCKRAITLICELLAKQQGVEVEVTIRRKGETNVQNNIMETAQAV